MSDHSVACEGAHDDVRTQVKVWMVRNKKTQAETADLIGVAHATFSAILNGRAPAPPTALKIRDLMSIPIDAWYEENSSHDTGVNR